MSPVVRLTVTYFTGTRLQRWMTLAAAVLIGLGVFGLLKYPALVFVGPQSNVSGESIAFSALISMSSLVGVLTLFFSAALMPVMFAHMARGRHLHMLPFGRIRLLASVLLTICLIAGVFAMVILALYIYFPIQPESVFWKSFAIAVLTFSPMYLLVWLVSRAKGAIGLLSGAMLVIPCLALPFHFVQIPQPPLRTPLAVGVLIGVICSAAFLGMPRWRHWNPIARHRPQATGLSVRRAYSQGTEFALLVGVARPWILSAGLIVPVAVATLFITSPNIWLCYLMLCSVISGGISNLSVSRSRALWLRGSWSRTSLHSRLEKVYWRQNAYCLSALIILMVAIGSYMEFQTALLVVGIPLLIVGCAAGTYLGLMMTRGIGWLDGICAGGTMLLMLGVALYALSLPYLALAIADLVLAGLAIAFRLLSRSRWAQLDWILCRPPARRDSQAL